jgi:hypothetical protein
MHIGIRNQISKDMKINIKPPYMPQILWSLVEECRTGDVPSSSRNDKNITLDIYRHRL